MVYKADYYNDAELKENRWGGLEKRFVINTDEKRRRGVKTHRLFGYNADLVD